MTAAPFDFGSLNAALAATDPAANLQRSIEQDEDFIRQHPEIAASAYALTPGKTINLLRSAGPVSDAYILNANPVSCIAGPQGSGKTIASQKKVLLEGQRIFPGANGVRRYVIGVFRQKYDSLWKATIPSWWEVFPKDFPGSRWTGASPRAAMHVIRFADAWGEIEITVHFLAFGEDANTEDLRGLRFTDVLLPEMDTLPEDLLTWLLGRVGRDPPPETSGRQGRAYGDMNAPDVLNWSYKKFYSHRGEGYALYRQPGGLDEGAENLDTYKTPADPTGRGYYLQQAQLNAGNDWWVRRMVHAIPGMSRATDLVYPRFDERTMVARYTIRPEPMLPVVVGIDGGLTPAAVYIQEMRDGTLHVLGEIALERGGPEELGAAMLAYEAHRFAGAYYEFLDVCDPSMTAGEDKDDIGERERRVSKGSDRQRLAAVLERGVRPAASQVPQRRWDAVRAKIPGSFLLDPSCAGLLRGFLQTYHLRKLRGTNDLSSVQPTFDTHVHDALQYAAMECGTEAARKRASDRRRERERRRAEVRARPPRRLLQRWSA